VGLQSPNDKDYKIEESRNADPKSNIAELAPDGRERKAWTYQFCTVDLHRLLRKLVGHGQEVP